MDSVAGRVALQGVTVHVADVSADPLVSGFQRRISDKVKTAMGVPLKQGGRVVGIISVWHTHVQPFTERQIKLVETFADQAVVAINNVGLFEEVQARAHDLTESLQQQTATADVLKVISRSTFDLQTVLNTVVEAAARLCEAVMAQIKLATRRETQVIVSRQVTASRANTLNITRTSRLGRGEAASPAEFFLRASPCKSPMF
jgi:GAF domain-containing protein